MRAYRDDFDKERRDKERLQRLLRERGAVQVKEIWITLYPYTFSYHFNKCALFHIHVLTCAIEKVSSY